MTLDLLYSEWYGRMIISWSNGIGLSEWNCWSSGLHSEEIPVGGNCCALNVVDLWVVSLGRVSRSGLLPYPVHVIVIRPRMDRGQRGEGIGDSSDPIFMLPGNRAWVGEAR